MVPDATRRNQYHLWGSLVRRAFHLNEILLKHFVPWFSFPSKFPVVFPPMKTAVLVLFVVTAIVVAISYAYRSEMQERVRERARKREGENKRVGRDERRNKEEMKGGEENRRMTCVAEVLTSPLEPISLTQIFCIVLALM